MAIALSKTHYDYDLKDNLQHQGKDFQYRALKACLSDPVYFGSIADKLKPEYFDIQGTKTSSIAEIMIEYAKKNGKGPTPVEVKDLFKAKANDDETTLKAYAVSYTMIDEASLEGSETTKDILTKFAQRHFIVDVCNGMYTKLGHKNYEEDPMMILRWGSEKIDTELSNTDKVFQCGAPIDVRDKLFDDTVQEYIPTGEEHFDDMINGGGVPKGTIAGFIAPSNYGKSTILTMFACNAVMNGFKVLHIIFEDKLIDIYKKYYAKVTGVPVYRMNEKNREEYEHIITNDPNVQKLSRENIWVQEMPNKETTYKDIERLIRKCQNDGFYPDVVFVDYFNCLKYSSNDHKDIYAAQGETIKKLENIAKTFNIVIWTAFQTNKADSNKESDDADIRAFMRGSSELFDTPYLFISVRRDPSDSTARRFTIEKNRGGSKCRYSNVKFYGGELRIDWTRAQIEQLDATETPMYQPCNNDPELMYDFTKDEPNINVREVKPGEFKLETRLTP